jgi:hypothetical protein
LAEQPNRAAHIEERLVEAEGLDQSGEGEQDRADLARHARVMVHADGQEYAFGAEPARGPSGHR